MTARRVTNRLTRRGSTPPLQLYDVAFRIARINDTKQTDTFYFGLGNFSHCSAASGDHCLQCLIDVVHCIAASTLLCSARNDESTVT